MYDVPIFLWRAVRSALLVTGVWSVSALAADPLNSNNRPDTEKPAPIVSAPDASHPDDDSPHNDLNVVPVVGGSTDLGFGGGYFAGLARVKKGAVPYLWNIDSSGLITFKYSAAGGFTVPYQDLYARLTIPRLFGSPLRLEIRPSYTWESIDYFGMGNASSRAAADQNANKNYSKYQRGLKWTRSSEPKARRRKLQPARACVFLRSSKNISGSTSSIGIARQSLCA